MNPKISTILILSLLAKMLLCLWIPLALDEYYYFLWGQIPSLSYFDHPPMTGWLMILAQPLKGLAEGAIRWPFVIMGHLTLLIWLKLLNPILSEKRLLLFLWVALLNPLWGLGGMIATPDIPLVFHWSLALFFTCQLLDKDSWQNYLGLGASLGLAFLSKYQVVIFIPCLLILIMQTRLWTRLLNLKAIFAVLTAVVFCGPVLYWNYQNDWASFSFQWKHGMADQNWQWKYPLEYLGGQILLIFPVFLIFIKNSNKDWLRHWLTPFAFFPFAFFLYSSFKGRVEGNWVIMAFPSVYALAVIFTSEKSLAWLKRGVYLWAFLLMGVLASMPYLPKNKLHEPQKFFEVLKRINPESIYLTNSFQMSGYLSFQLGQLVCKLPKYGRRDHLDFVESCKSLPSHFYYISETDHHPEIDKDFPGFFEVGREKIDSKFVFIEVKQK